jgi:NADH dehydrogenase FAD-containing subunit
VNTVIVAIGQVPDPSFVEGLDLGANGTFTVDTDSLATNVPGVFAAGDAVQVPGSIVGAIAEGHTAACSIDAYLSGKDLKDAAPEPLKEVYSFEDDIEVPDFLAKKDRWDMPSLTAKDAVRSFSESELGYTIEQVIEEAKRCMNCRMCANCLFGRGQVCLETSSRLLATE